jgi:hypothetical protein
LKFVIAKSKPHTLFAAVNSSCLSCLLFDQFVEDTYGHRREVYFAFFGVSYLGGHKTVAWL